MAMAKIWTALVVLSVVYGAAAGHGQEVAAAAMEGARAAINLAISILGITCLWTGVMEIMTQSGLAGKLAKFFSPMLSRLFPESASDPKVMNPLSANFSANLLGLGNAATPLGIQAAQAMQNRSKSKIASDDLCMLVVINTSSIQLIPATVAAVRAGAGCATPFDIMPSVWFASLVSAGSGIILSMLCSKFLKKPRLGI